MSEEASKCPKCGKTLALVHDRYLECFCGYVFDTLLSREAIGRETPRRAPSNFLNEEPKAAKLDTETKLFGHTPPFEEYGTAEQLYDTVRAFVRKYWDVPDERGYDVFASWILATWTPEQWEAVP